MHAVGGRPLGAVDGRGEAGGHRPAYLIWSWARRPPGLILALARECE
jgi:hypothetical protein